MKMKNFQMVFHHWPKEIFATARPATVIPATGLMVLMVWFANCSAVTAASGLRPMSSVSGPMTGMVSAARPELDGTSRESRPKTIYMNVV